MEDFFFIIRGILREKTGCFLTLSDFSILCKIFSDRDQKTNEERYPRILCVGQTFDHPNCTSLTYNEFAEKGQQYFEDFKLFVFFDAHRLTYWKNPHTKKFMMANFRSGKLLIIYPPKKQFVQGNIVLPDKPTNMTYCAKKLNCFGADTLRDVYRKYFSDFYGLSDKYLVKGPPNQRRAYSYYMRVKEKYPLLDDRKNQVHWFLSPSKIQNQSKCHGAFWMEGEAKHTPYAGWRGTIKHSHAEHYIKEYEAKRDMAMDDIDDEVNMVTLQNNTIYNYIKYCANQIQNTPHYGIEDRIASKKIDRFGGTVDFWSYDEGSNMLEIVDLKTGRIVKEVHFHTQLSLYAMLIMEKHDYIPSDVRIKHTIFNKNERATRILPVGELGMIRAWFGEYIKGVYKAKENPTQYLDRHCTNYYCGARGYHTRIHQSW